MHTLAQLKSGQLLGVKHLSLSENLTSFPDEVLLLADSLEILDLSNNQLSQLPDTVAKLAKLKIIFLSNNHFESLPEVLGQCSNLEMIGIKSNTIRHVASTALPPKLRWLTLTDNQIETLPDSLGERPRLQKLMLAGNRLTALPHTLSNAHNLELLRISANQLHAFPEQILSLPKLAWLAFAGNPFCLADDTTEAIPHIPSSHFTLQQQLGEGASGIISAARWHNTQSHFPNDIAVKIFKGGVTSDGYPLDELNACLKAGHHPNLIKSIAQVKEADCAALIMERIPSHYRNLGQPPSFESCTRDTFAEGFYLAIDDIIKITEQMTSILEHLHANHIAHGDLYAHNTLIDNNANILFGDFGAASPFHMLTNLQQQKIIRIEQRALQYFINDLLSLCQLQDQDTHYAQKLKQNNAVLG